jgi:hypothetical protein
MRALITNQRRRKRYLFVASLSLFVGIGLTPAFQTWACRLVLNKATGNQGLNWSVEQASIRLFPLAIELDNATLTNAYGTNLRFNHVAVSLEGLGSPSWHVAQLLVEGVEGVAVNPKNDATSTKPTTAPQPFSLVVDAASVRDVHVEFRTTQSAVLLEWELLTLAEMNWDGTYLNGTFQVPQAMASPLPLNDNPWSGAWTDPMALEGMDVQIQSNDSVRHIAMQTGSNWGVLSTEWRVINETHTIAFQATPNIQKWPIRPEHWLNKLPQVVSDSVISGALSWHPESGGIGSFSQLGVEVPLAYSGSTWKIGPIKMDTTQLEFFTTLAGMPFPSYFSMHPHWNLEGEYDGAVARAQLTPSAGSSQYLSLSWDRRADQSEFTASLVGFALDWQRQDLRPGGWQLNGNGRAGETGWQGNLIASHPDGDAVTTAWNAEWGPSDWSFSTDTRIEQLVRHTDSDSPWELYARIGWRGSGTDEKNWTQVLEVRDIVLLENNIPRSFDRFDAIQKRNLDAWSVEWASGITSGKAQCNSALLTDCSFNPTRLAFEPRTQSASTPPQLDVQIQVANLKPIALLADLPFTTSEPFSIHAGWNGTKGMLQTNISSLFFGGVTVSNVSVNGTLQSEEPSLLNWEAHGFAFNDTPVFDEALGQLTAGAAGLELAIESCIGEAGNEAFTLQEPASVFIDAETSACSMSTMRFLSSGGAVEFSGGFNHASDWNLQAHMAHRGFGWGSAAHNVSGIDGTLTLLAGPGEPTMAGSFTCENAQWGDFAVVDVQAAIAGTTSAPQLTFEANALPSGSIRAAIDLPWNDLPTGHADVAFTDLDLAPVNGLLPPESIELNGQVSGELTVHGLDGFPRIDGEVVPQEVTLAVPYLGTRYRAEGTVKVQPDGFFMDQWALFDGDSTEARFNGTVLHTAFKEWDLDFGIEIRDRPIALMDIPITDDALFYGTAKGTGDINVSGFGPVLEIDALLETGRGTDFALPMDSRNDVDYADFVRFKMAQVESEITAAPRGTFSDTRLNLGIDVNEGAQARIVFNRKVGDEIVGNAVGHLDLEVKDFEQLDMTGNLEITEGAYHFTLQNWFNKRFDIQSGSTVSWEGDPYDAQLNVATTYTTRTSLDPLLPEINDLPGRIPVELQLQLKGSMLRPGLDFNVAVPTADSRIQALVEGALVNEEAVQRQALGLLTLSQFIPTDPTTAAVGGFIQPAQSTQFLANQLGHWISQIAPSMDVGLDYAQDALSGEQEVGLALSTQLLNDRLHIEGEVGAQTFGNVQAEDFQIQDLTVSFDLTDDGGIQLTGHSRQNASLTNAIEGDAVQGVGIRFKWAFDEWAEWKNR